MPSLTRIFTSGLIATILAFTALGVAFAEENSDSGTSTSADTTSTSTTPTGAEDNSAKAEGNRVKNGKVAARSSGRVSSRRLVSFSPRSIGR